MRRAVTVIGIGDDGCASLTSRAASAIEPPINPSPTMPILLKTSGAACRGAPG